MVYGLGKAAGWLGLPSRTSRGKTRSVPTTAKRQKDLISIPSNVIDSVKAQVIPIVANVTKSPLEKINLNTKLNETALKIDSMTLFDICLQVEKAFDILINNNDWDRLKTVGGLVKYIARKITPSLHN